jgi:hypothetical protein
MFISSPLDTRLRIKVSKIFINVDDVESNIKEVNSYLDGKKESVIFSTRDSGVVIIAKTDDLGRGGKNAR